LLLGLGLEVALAVVDVDAHAAEEVEDALEVVGLGVDLAEGVDHLGGGEEALLLAADDQGLGDRDQLVGAGADLDLGAARRLGAPGALRAEAAGSVALRGDVGAAVAAEGALVYSHGERERVPGWGGPGFVLSVTDRDRLQTRARVPDRFRV